jgi:hypothetical protein
MVSDVAKIFSDYADFYLSKVYNKWGVVRKNFEILPKKNMCFLQFS